jgi:hypothetical protein
MRVCVEAGCPELTTTTRCPAHTRERDKARGTRQQRGYDSHYDMRRKTDVRNLANGAVLTCWRCGGVVLPHDYSLGHCDDDRRVIHGPEHLRSCNLANTRGGCPHPSHISPAA